MKFKNIKEETAIRVSLVCPYCSLRNNYDFYIENLILEVNFPGFTNLDAKIIDCKSCQCDFLTHISYQIAVEILTRRIEPESLSALDNGEYKLDKNGIAQENIDNLQTDEFDPNNIYE